VFFHAYIAYNLCRQCPIWLQRYTQFHSNLPKISPTLICRGKTESLVLGVFRPSESDSELRFAEILLKKAGSPLLCLIVSATVPPRPIAIYRCLRWLGAPSPVPVASRRTPMRRSSTTTVHYCCLRASTCFEERTALAMGVFSKHVYIYISGQPTVCNGALLYCT
jgi:hypothetical protein